jgi:hypothetical protein
VPDTAHYRTEAQRKWPAFVQERPEMSFAQVLDLAINMTENKIFGSSEMSLFKLSTARYLCLVALFENQTKGQTTGDRLFKEPSTKDLTLS